MLLSSMSPTGKAGDPEEESSPFVVKADIQNHKQKIDKINKRKELI